VCGIPGAVTIEKQIDDREWVETDGLGGFASGTVGGVRTRRYHALLLHATTPPTGRMVLVNGLDAFVETRGGRFALTTQRYVPGVHAPDGERRIRSFQRDPWPTWTFAIDHGNEAFEIEHDLFVSHERSECILRWRLPTPRPGVTLEVRPFLSGRDYHALHHENGAFAFEPRREGAWHIWTTYQGVPSIAILSNGEYRHDPHWYRNFHYPEEAQRGLDAVEDLAAPGVFRFDLGTGEAVLILRAGSLTDAEDARRHADEVCARESERRGSFSSSLDRAADQYVVRRGRGRTIIAGYPWFTDWGRDTFIALRGLCGTRDRLDVARDILIAWSNHVSEGMLPNLFPDGEKAPEYNAVDASLWYVIAVHDHFAAMRRTGRAIDRAIQDDLRRAIHAILEGYARGTRYGIRADRDGLLSAGEPGVQLTWMDAKVGDHVVTPRIGKPVEVQALWINALRIGATFEGRWSGAAEQATRSFAERFWSEAHGHLFDVVDVDHHAGAVDTTFRPNQIFAVGGLPFAVLTGDRARCVVDAVEARLHTPLGLRTLAEDDAKYRPRYEGGPYERDTGYHQGTVWPWLIGAFVDAWLRVRGRTREAKIEARRRFIEPLLAHLEDAGLGHVSEIADAKPPHRPRGCPFQAWSVGELIRAIEMVSDGGAYGAAATADDRREKGIEGEERGARSPRPSDRAP
jgi:predicted glycogen debranching enzyme